MKPSGWLIFSLTSAIAFGMIGFLYWNSPERHIRAVLSDSVAAVKAKDLDRIMSHVSLQYRDEQGLAYLPIKRLIKKAFDQFDGLDVRLTDIKIDINKNQAIIQADLEVFVVSQSKKASLIGDRQEPVSIRMTLAGEALKWKVLSVNGFKLPITEF